MSFLISTSSSLSECASPSLITLLGLTPGLYISSIYEKRSFTLFIELAVSFKSKCNFSFFLDACPSFLSEPGSYCPSFIGDTLSSSSSSRMGTVLRSFLKLKFFSFFSVESGSSLSIILVRRSSSCWSEKSAVSLFSLFLRPSVPSPKPRYGV